MISLNGIVSSFHVDPCRIVNIFQARLSHLCELENASLPNEEFADSSESAEFATSGNVNCLVRDGRSAVRGGAVRRSAEMLVDGGCTDIVGKTRVIIPAKN